MKEKDLKLDTYAKNTWCPGCANFAILAALKNAVSSLVEKGTRKKDIVLVSGIGCSSKIIDYLNLNSFSSLHGRPIVSAEGIKMGNPDLKVIVCAGDGGIYNEGISHLVHAAKRNSDITVLVHNNRIFALTTGQFTATSPLHFKGKSTPEGSIEKPINPLKIVLASNGTFVSRGYSLRGKHLEGLIVKAAEHEGFSFIDVLQPCISFFNNIAFYNEKVYQVEERDLDSQKEALKKIEEWDYNKKEGKIPIGLFYKVQEPACWRKSFSQKRKEVDFKKFLRDNH